MFSKKHPRQTGRSVLSLTLALATLINCCTALAATDITIGSPVVDQLTNAGEIDEYNFTGIGGDRLYFDAQQGAGNHALIWTLKDPAGNEVFSKNFVDPTDAIQLTTTGVYTLSIQDSQLRNNVDYGFQIFAVPEPVSQDYRRGQLAFDTIVSPGYISQFSFDGFNGDRLYFDAKLGSGNHDFTWRLFAPDGSLLFSDRFTNRDPQLLTQSGLYSLEIIGQQDNTGDFSFAVYDVPDTPLIPVELDRLVSGAFDVPGASAVYTFSADAGQTLYFENGKGFETSGYYWNVQDSAGHVIAGSANGNFQDIGPVVMADSAIYHLFLDARGDSTGPYSFQIHTVPDDPAERNISLDEFIYGALKIPGSGQNYRIGGNAGETVYLHILENDAGAQLSMTAPNGEILFNRQTRGRSIELPQDGDYRLRVETAGSRTGVFIFVLSGSATAPDFPPTADLIVTDVVAPSRVTGNPASLDISWTVVNQGAVSASAWTDRILLNQGGASQTVTQIDPLQEVLAEDDHNLTLAPGESYTRSVQVALPDDFSGNFEISVEADVNNQVFEAMEGNNSKAAGGQTWIRRQERVLTKNAIITSDQADGSHYPAGTQLALSGQVQLFPGAINALFIIDVSASTELQTGLDANFDGQVDLNDDLNEDGGVGDILDTEIGAVLNLVDKMQSRSDDLLVAAMPFAGAAWPLDSGTPAFNQVFVDPSENLSVGERVADFEEALRSLHVVSGFFSGADLFNRFWVRAGTNFQTAIQEANNVLENAPAADRTLVFLVTDGESTASPTAAEIEALAAHDISLFAYQIGNDQISPALDSLVTAVDAQSLATATARLVKDPADLSNALASAVELAGVLVNGQGVKSLDAVGHYFTPVQIAAGENRFVIDAVDSNGRNTSHSITLIGDDDSADNVVRRDLSGNVEVKFSNTSYNRRSKQLSVQAHLLNVGPEPQIGPFNATVQPVIPASVELANPAGVVPEGIPYINFALLTGTDSLLAGEQSLSYQLLLDNPAEQRFSIQLNPQGISNAAPEIFSVPPVSVAAGATYEYQIAAGDADGHQLHYSLLQAPFGMAIASTNGRIQWQTHDFQFGTYAVSILVEDGFGGSAAQRFQLSVIDPGINLPPIFQSSPPVNLDSGLAYDYAPQVLDANNDALHFSLQSGSSAFSIDPNTGVVSSHVLTDGAYDIVITVDDNRGGRTDQAFTVQVGGVTGNTGVPLILSTPGATGRPGFFYQYQPFAADPDGDPLEYTLPQAPPGMQIDNQNGLITWVADASQLGGNPVLLRVEDPAGNYTTQLFIIEISASLPNLPPAIISVPEMFASEGSVYRYQVVASDPDEDKLTFMLTSAPAGMTLDPDSGLLSYLPGASDLGVVQIGIQVQDTALAVAEQTYRLEVRETNQAPEFISSPVETATAGTIYRYASKAEDSRDRVHYSLISGPAGLEIDRSSGLLTLNADASQIGDHPVGIRATDERGLFAEQTYTLSIQSDRQAPVVSITSQPGSIVNPGDTISLQVSAVDNVDLQIPNLALHLNGSPLTLDAEGKADYLATASGLFRFEATATDSAANTGKSTLILRVVDPTDQTPPQISFSSPSPGSLLDRVTDITGTVADDKQLEFYRLEVAPLDNVDLDDLAAPNAAWRLLAESDHPVSEGVLGRFDAAAVRNDAYVLRVTAQDVSGHVNLQAMQLNVGAAAKLGRLNLEVQDFEMPMLGAPIRVFRRYDSFDAGNQGDFGFGWKLAYADPDLRLTVPLHPMEKVSSSGLVVNPISTGTRVYLNDPDGKRIGFTFEPKTAISLLGPVFIPEFTPDPGVYDSLEVDPVALKQNADGSYHVFPYSLDYNPANYRLRRRDGTVYHYNKYAGLQRISDRNGNEISFDADGIHSSDGSGIDFIRDENRRIIRIEDDKKIAVSYNYDAKGNLTGFTDQTDNHTAYTYYDDPAHILKEIVDPQGHAAQIGYDSSGRVSGITDGLGNNSAQTWDSDHFTGTITDARGNTTLLQYDSQGNLLESTDPLGHTTRFEYDDDNNVIAETDPLGNTRQYAYDEQGNKTRVVDPLGNETVYQFNDYGEMASVTNALGVGLHSEFDDNGNLTRVTLPEGAYAEFSYDDFGRMLVYKDFRGNATRFEYSGNQSQPTSIIDPEGNRTEFVHNYLGRTIRIADPSGEVTRFIYDAAGRLIEIIDPLGNSSKITYTDGLRTALTDPLEHIQTWSYDAAGNPAVFTNALGAQVHFGYDASGNRTSVTDPLGNVYRFEYDAMNRLISETDPANAARTHQYDGNGNRIRSTDRNGRVRLYVYDALNRLIEESWHQGDTLVNRIQSSYDELGRLVKITDNASQLSFTYDDMNRLIQTDNQGTTGVSRRVLDYHYDDNDNRVRIIDDQGVEINSVYDLNDRLLTRTLLGDSVMRIDLSYNARGERTELARSADADGTALLAKTLYRSDALGRVLGIEHRDASAGSIISAFTNNFDQTSRLTGTEHHGQSFLYGYDAAGQLISADRDLFGNVAFSYDAAGNPDDATTLIGAGNRLLAYKDYDYDYDQEGNLIEKINRATGETDRYSYDHLNRLVQVDVFDDNGVLLHQSAYTYDALGRRILLNEDGAVTGRVYYGDTPWLDHDGNSDIHYLHTDRIDELAAQSDTLGIQRWLLSDHLHTTHDVIDSAANIVNHIDYDSFGALRDQSDPAAAVRHLFTGREYDPLADLYHYRTRAYDPVTGRFTSPDSIGFDSGDFNLYRYVGNSPQNAIDPNGQSLVEYNALICNFSLPITNLVGSVFPCTRDLFNGISNSLETLNGGETLVQAFGACAQSNGMQALLDNLKGFLGGLSNNKLIEALTLTPHATPAADPITFACFAKP